MLRANLSQHNWSFRHQPEAMLIFFLVTGLGFCAPILARDQLYGAIDNPALQQCDDQHFSGQLTAAETCYRNLLGTEQSQLIKAEAFWALGDLQDANAMFQSATDADLTSALPKLRWGELFMQTYQYQEAYNLFAEALGIDPENAFAHVGAARALAQGGNEEEVNTHLASVTDNAFAAPGAQYRVMLMMIKAALEQDKYDDARNALDTALEFGKEQKLPLQEVYALEAAHAFMTRANYQPFVDIALAANPAYGDVWATLGYFATNIRRYRESGEFYEKAVAIQPDHWEAHLELGQNYLRLNQVTPAIDHIKTSFAGDAFNPKTINMLRMLDTFQDEMEIKSFPNPPAGPFPHLQLRLGKTETAVLEKYARKLAEESIDLYTQRYRFTPNEPITVEIFPNHEDFVVRSIGMPGVGLLGVTFGYLFAMDSPTAHPQGESYHWGTTLWHEMAHVFTIEATNHLIPRWYSEGISVFEEWRTGPTPGRKIPNNVLKAMTEGKFLSVAKLDDGFMRPSYEDQVIVTYMQSGLVFEFIDIEYGFDKIVDILYQLKDGTDAVTAIETTLGISVADFDAHFKQFIDIEYGPLLNGMTAWQEDQQASFAALETSDWQAAIAAGQRANFTYPDYVEVDSPYIAMARAYSRLEDKDNEFLTLQTFWQKGGYAPRSLLTLAAYYLERADQNAALEVLTDVLWSDPFSEDVHIKLGDLYLALDQPQAALEEFQVLLALDPIDKADANLKMATAYRALNNTELTMQHLMTALDIAPQYRPAQMLLLEISRKNPQ